MNDSNRDLERHQLTIAQRIEIDRICGEFDRAWRTDLPRDLKSTFASVARELQSALFEELLKIEIEYRSKTGTPIPVPDYLQQFPQFQTLITRQFDPPRPQFDPRMDAITVTQTRSETHSQAAKLVELIRQYQNESATGMTIDPAAWGAQHPEYGAPLVEALQGLEEMRQAADSQRLRRQIGDFTIIREIGRGGMGAVFEAEQKSLARRVALKVLWFGTSNDFSAIQRFQREAETIAQLHHTHIVPIYSVGTEGSIKYFAMQLIDGQSLDQIIQDNPNGMDPITVVNWGLQVAEALAHAHLRGVVHRDVKPSNLLLDRAKQIWLTDFGLAKRSDDVTLSMAGALMGTPRYMSPEQASASTRDVDHRSDIYSLGATLYELLTGQPVHNANTPHGIISQILTAEIVPPRQRRGDVPRDIDTVLMKCLDKEPGKRYESANDLASDLRAILESRPIQARRTGLVEHCQKWLMRHRRNLNGAAASVGGTLAALLLCWMGWLTYTALTASQLTIETAEGNLIAEIFDSRGKAVTQPIAVPMQSPITLPSGDYRARFTADRYLSQDTTLTLKAQQPETVTYNLSEQRSFEPMIDVHDVAFVRGNHRTRIVTYDDERIQIKDGDRPTYSLPWSTIQDDGRVPGWIWPINKLVMGNNKFGLLELRPWILEQGEDLNGDGESDFVIAFRHQACVAAADRNGWLWVNGSTRDLATSNSDEGNRTNYGVGMKSTIADSPRWINDLNGDGTKDLLVCFSELGDKSLNELIRNQEISQASNRWLEVLSGATGKSIWRYDLPQELFDLPPGEQAPVYRSWYPSSYRSLSSSSRASTYGNGRSLLVRDYASLDTPTGPAVELPTVAVGSIGNQPAIVVASSRMFLAIDQQEGLPLIEPTSTGVASLRIPLFGDLNGDGQTDLLLVSENPNRATSGDSQVSGDNQVTAWSIADRKVLWSHNVESDATGQRSSRDPHPEIGLVEDLDRDGLAEVLIPGRTSKSLNASRYPWGELQAVGGVDGQLRWTARIYNCDSTADRFLVGPDVNGDAVRDVFVVSQWGNCDQLVAESRSGKDGSLLWIQSHPILQDGQSYFVSPPALWHSGADGWPQVVVTLRGRSAEPLVVTFSTRDGHVSHVTSGFDETRIVDADGDHVEDLCLIENKLPGQMNISNGLDAVGVRGTVSEVIRQVGVDQVLNGTDFDGDEIQDCLLVCGDDLVAKSSSDGRVIWRASEVQTMPSCRAITWESNGADPNKKGLWDFDEDGIRDFILDRTGIFTTASFEAISGRTGRQISEFDFVRQSQQGNTRMDLVDIDRDGQGEWIAYGFSDFDIDRHGGFDTTQGRMSLAVFDIRTGQAKWRTALSREFGGSNNPRLNYDFSGMEQAEFLTADQNDDGVLDLIALAESDQTTGISGNLMLVCCDGRDGSIMWRRATNALTTQPERVFKMAPSLALFARDSSLAGNVLLLEATPSSNPMSGGLTLRCLDTAGRDLWSYVINTTTEVGNHHDQRRLRPAPVVLVGDGGHARIVCQAQVGNVRWQLIVVDENGQKVGEIETQQNNFPANFLVQPVDRPGEVNDSVLYWGNTDNEPRLFQAQVWGDVKKIREFPMIGVDPQYTDLVLDRLAPDEGSSIRVIVSEQARLRATCFDLASGTMVWKCLGPTAGAFAYPALNVQVLLNSNPKTAQDHQHVLFFSDNQVFCRTANSASQDSGSAFANSSSAGVIKDAYVGSQDFRLARYLPGVERVRAEINDGMLRWVIISGISSLVLVVIPIWHFQKMIRRRRWSIRSMMLGIAILALGLVFILSPVPKTAIHTGGATPIWLVGFMAIYATPVWIFLFAVVRWSWARQFGRLAAALAGVLVMSFVTALAMMLEPQLGIGGATAEPGEYVLFTDPQQISHHRQPPFPVPAEFERQLGILTVIEQDRLLQQEIGNGRKQQNGSIESRRQSRKVILAHPSRDKRKKRKPEQQMHVGPHD